MISVLQLLKILKETLNITILEMLLSPACQMQGKKILRRKLKFIKSVSFFNWNLKRNLSSQLIISFRSLQVSIHHCALHVLLITKVEHNTAGTLAHLKLSHPLLLVANISLPCGNLNHLKIIFCLQ